MGHLIDSRPQGLKLTQLNHELADGRVLRIRGKIQGINGAMPVRDIRVLELNPVLVNLDGGGRRADRFNSATAYVGISVGNTYDGNGRNLRSERGNRRDFMQD